jgi:hypothetical protein
MREYMQLKRAAKKVGLDHLPISELKSLFDAGELVTSTATTPNTYASTSHKPGTQKTNDQVPLSIIDIALNSIPTWGYILFIVCIVVCLFALPVYLSHRDSYKKKNDQDS